jgi:hypothetical protein
MSTVGQGQMSMTQADDFADDFEHLESQTYWSAWGHSEILTLREAACLLAGIDPGKYRYSNRVMPTKAEALSSALEQAIKVGSLQPFAVYGWDDNGDRAPLYLNQVSPHAGISDVSTAKVEDLAVWCDKKGITHYWPRHKERTPQTLSDSRAYPPELQAAIEAFEAVSNDPQLTVGRSVKAALTEWLRLNKTDLSNGACERIATVANWQPSGGAPKTPGG